MRISIIYHSETGNTENIANIISSKIEKLEDIETKCMSIENIDKEFVEESKVIFFGTPTYAGSYSWQMKKWLDTSEIKFAGKVGCVFATANFIGGGAEIAEMAIISELLVKGMFVFSVGASEGKPYTHFGAVCIKDGNKEQRERVEIFAERVVQRVKNILEKAIL